MENQFGALVDSLFEGEECLFVSMGSLMQPLQSGTANHRNTSIFQLLEVDEHFPSARSQQYKSHPYIDQFTVEELKNCITTGEIYRN